jgi:Transposase DDE domain group 1
MQTECSADLVGFAPVAGRAVVAGFDGGKMTSDAGALLLGATDRAVRLVDRFAECFADSRAPELIEHTVRTLVGQRIFALALGYEDLVDHDELRHDPTMAVLAGKLAARRKDCAPLAGKSTLNRLERGGPELTRYHRIAWDGAKIEGLFVDLFLEAHQSAPQRIILDLDATDDPLHGHQRGASFTATTTAIATCRCIFSAVRICWPPSCGAPTSMRRPGRSRRRRALSHRSARIGPRCG